ncbi:MAG TPA: hypothetical protein VMS98_11105 [Thermoanaerobaculia bacterium]|nr:hypothetical protein [Thermoanaerobaculia bacterium]
MRKTTLSLCALLVLTTFVLTTPLLAAPKRATLRTGNPDSVRVERLPAGSDLFQRVSEQYRASARNRHRATVATEIRSARAFIIPVAGSAPGGGGTFFRSDITIANYGQTSQDLSVAWIARGVTTATPPTVVVTIPARTAQPFRDFVTNVLGQSGIGSIFVIPIAGNQLDEDASIDGFSRIYTNQPGSAGTVSQPFEGVDPDSFLRHFAASSLGLRHDASFRTNYFIVNTDSVPLTFTIFFSGSNGFESERTVTVNPASLFFDSVPPADSYGDLTIVFIVDEEDAFWTAGASSTDNITADGYVSIASANLSDEDLDGFDR